MGWWMKLTKSYTEDGKYIPHEMIDGVDKDIVELVEVLNDERSGLTTLFSCQGGSESWPMGYIMFSDDTKQTAAVAAKFLILMNEEISKRWGMLTPKARLKKEFCFQTEISNHHIMRWLPKSYKYVLGAAKIILSRREWEKNK